MNWTILMGISCSFEMVCIKGFYGPLIIKDCMLISNVYFPTTSKSLECNRGSILFNRMHSYTLS